MLALRKANIYTFYKDAFPLKILGFYKQMNLHREINKRNLYIDKLIDSFPGTTKEEQSLILNKTYIKKKKSTSMKKKKLIIKTCRKVIKGENPVKFRNQLVILLLKMTFFLLLKRLIHVPVKMKKKRKNQNFIP